MANNRIPLFRIPFLVLCMILDHYSFYEMIQLSLCSKQSLRVAKNCWKKKVLVNASLYTDKPPHIDICYYPASFYTFSIYSTKDLRDRQAHNIQVSDAFVPSIDGCTETITYWDDKVFGIEQTVRYIRDLFGVSINSVELRKQENPNDIIRIIDAIKSSQESIKNCRLHFMEQVDDCLKHVLDNFKTTEYLWICGDISRQFRHNWNIHLDDLYISNGSSFTLQNLTNIDCRSLDLCSSSLTSKDLNQFLKHWQNGGNSRIRFATIVINSLNQKTITSGIEVTQPQRFWRLYQSVSDSKVQKYGGLDIQRNDGTTGTIFIYTHSFEFGVDPEVVRRQY